MRILEAAGYVCTRAGASLGVFDVIAVGPRDVRLVQVKAGAQYLSRHRARADRGARRTGERLPRVLALSRPPPATADREAMTNVTTGRETLGGYLSIRMLAAYSGLSVRTLRGYLADRVRPLPHFRVGGKILIARTDFDRWVAQFCVQATATAVSSLVDDVVNGLR